MRILVTRPKREAEATAAKLAARGHEPIIAPLLEIEFAPGPELSIEDVKTAVVTSANGIRALARRTPRRDLRVIAVGMQSAAVAQQLGFADIDSAGGDADALIDCVAAKLSPENGPLLYPAGGETRSDVAARLHARGFQVRSEVLYRARAAQALPATAHDALSAHRLDATLFYSPRTAQIFCHLARKDLLDIACTGIVAACISKAAADALTIRFKDVRIAIRPNQADLFDLL